MLRKKNDESFMEFSWRMMDEDRNINYNLSKIVNELMVSNGDEATDIPYEYDYVDTMDGLKWYRITNISTSGLVDSKKRAIIWVDFKIYDGPEDAKNDENVEKTVYLREFSDIPRRMQLFILRYLDLMYNE